VTLEVSRPQRIQLLEADSVSSLTSGLKVRSEVVLDETVFTVARDDYRTLCERLFDAGFDFPSSLTGVDMDWGLGVVLHLQQLESKRKVTVRVYVPYDEPRVPTVSDLWGGVDWHEREAYDLVGIHFDGHHDHRRILLEDHWTIHPLQRKYNTRGYVIPTWSAKPWPTPAPWEEGFTPFGAAAAPAVHAPKPAAPAATATSSAPAATSSEPAPAALSVPSSEPATPAAASAAGVTEAPKKAAKKWVPKTPAADAAPSSAEPAAAPPAPVEAPVVIPAPPQVETAPSSQSETTASSEREVREEKPRSPKIKRWEPKS
jgi:NADH:ubiquinone oxidoreductase subunit C